MIKAIVGFMTGILASMGLGGGFILVVWLTVFEDVQQRAAQGINVLFFIAVAFVSLILHLKNHLIDKVLVKKMLIGGILGAVVGTVGCSLVANELLRKLFALFLVAFGLRELFSGESVRTSR